TARHPAAAEPRGGQAHDAHGMVREVPRRGAVSGDCEEERVTGEGRTGEEERATGEGRSGEERQVRSEATVFALLTHPSSPDRLSPVAHPCVPPTSRPSASVSCRSEEARTSSGAR